MPSNNKNQRDCSRGKGEACKDSYVKLFVGYQCQDEPEDPGASVTALISMDEFLN